MVKLTIVPVEKLDIFGNPCAEFVDDNRITILYQNQYDLPISETTKMLLDDGWSIEDGKLVKEVTATLFVTVDHMVGLKEESSGITFVKYDHSNWSFPKEPQFEKAAVGWNKTVPPTG